MNVGAAARRSGLPAKTIRYYEEIGLIRPARADNGYRDYSPDDIHRLAFLRRARGLGFSIDDCRQLMALYRDKARASHDVREIAKSHVAAIEEKVRELQSMRATLQKLIHACHGDERPADTGRHVRADGVSASRTSGPCTGSSGARGGLLAHGTATPCRTSRA